MSVKQVAIRLKPEGGNEVVNEVGRVDKALDAMGASGKAAADKVSVAADREVAALLEVANAAKQAETALQQQINATTGVTGGGKGRASQSARTLGAADDIYDRKARDLLAEINPLAAAQDRLNKELAEYNTLARRGKITTEELAKAQALARRRFEETEKVLGRSGKVLTKNQAASRLNLTRQGADVFTTAMMGMNPAMIAVQQGPQIMDAWSTAGIKLSPVLVGVAAGATAVAAAIGVMAYAYYDAERSMLALDRAATGVGRTAGLTGEELRAAARAGAEAADISNRAAEKQALAYVSTGKIGGEIMTGLIGLSKDYARFMGIDAKDATEQLAKSFADPATAARDMTRHFGLMDQKTLENIESLMKQGDRLAAQKLLFEALNEAVDGHAEKVHGLAALWDRAATAFSNYISSIGDKLSEGKLRRLEQRANGVATGRSSNFGLTNPVEQGQAYYEWSMKVIRKGLTEWADDLASERAAENQQAQLKKDEAGKTKSGPKGKSAEQLAREALARQRREEDVAANLSLEIARLGEDHDLIRQLESEARLRTRIRQLIDDGMAAEEARTKAVSEEGQLLKAKTAAMSQQVLEMQKLRDLEVMRLLGEERSVQNLEDRIALEALIKSYQEKGYNLLAATNSAEMDRNQIIEARTEALRRANAEAELAHQANLARLRGDEELSRYYDIEQRIESRARDIERRKKLNYGEGVAEAQSQIQDELTAEATGARKAWIRGLLGDLKNGGVAETLFRQLDKASERWLDKLSESLAELDWGGFMKSLFGGSSGGGLGNAFSALFAVPDDGHSTGTEFSSGGWKWVGERGPELVRFRRGTEVMEHNRSMAFARNQGGGGGLSIGTLSVQNYGTEPVEASARMTPQGDLELILEPLIDRSISRAGRKGRLAKSLKSSPQTIRRA